MDGARYLIGRRFNLALHPEPTECQFCNRQFCEHKSEQAEMKTNCCAQEKSFLNGVTMPPAPRIQNFCSLRKKQRKKPRLPHLTPEQSLQSRRINAKTSGEDISSDFPLSPFPVVCLCLSSSGGGAFAVGGGRGVGGESIIRLKILIVGGKERGLCWAQVERRRK